MNLVVNGCSFTNWYMGQDTWAHYTHLQYPDLNFINLGKRGSTNDEIILNRTKFELNKIIGAVLLVALLVIGIGKVSNLVFKVSSNSSIFGPWVMYLPFRTSEKQPTFFNLDDTNGCKCPSPHGRTFPTALDPLYWNRYEIADFA